MNQPLEKYKGWMAVILQYLLQVNFPIAKESTFSGSESKQQKKTHSSISD